MSYFRKISQDIIASTLNTTLVALKKSPVSGYTWSGTGESTLGVAGIQVSVWADQNCKIWIEQSGDNSNWDISDYYEYQANLNHNFGVTVQAISSFVKVRAENESTTTDMNFFRLYTALCPIVEAVPRALDIDGNLMVGIKSMQDALGFKGENTPNGEKRTAEPVRLVGTGFDGTTVDTNFWTATVDATAGPGSVTQASGALTLNSGTANSSFSTLRSFRRARYVAGTPMRYRSQTQLGDTGIAGNVRRWGVGYGASMPTITNGAWFQLSGTTFSVVTMLATTPSTVTSFNGAYGTSFVLDTNVHTFEIYYNTNKVYFLIDGKLLHTVSASAASWSAFSTLYAYADNVNTTNTVAKTISFRTLVVYRLGKLETATIYKNFSTAQTGTVLKQSSGRLHRIIIGTVGSTTTTVICYDGVTAVNPIVSLSVDPTAGSYHAIPQNIEVNTGFYDGLTLTTTGTGANITIIYE